MAQPPVPAVPSSAAVSAFLNRAAGVPALRVAPSPARLIVAIDATASRQPTWDRACQVQGEMFAAVPGGSTGRATGGLAVSLAWYRGAGEFRATPFLTDARALAAEMTGVTCRGGHTQILRVLRHAEAEASRARLHALVLVGDAVEEEAGAILSTASRLGARGVPAFVFQEGDDPDATPVLKGLARATGGAWAPFDHRSPAALAALLRGAAAYAAGGRAALARLPGSAGLLAQIAAPPAGERP